MRVLYVLSCLAFFATAIPNIQAQTLEDDSLALVEFYNLTNGDDWNKNDHWLTDTMPVSSWWGVTVQNDRVTRIQLVNNGLTGSLCEFSFNLDALESLFLFFHDMTGEIPPAIGNLSSLTFLNLSRGSLSGPIPEEIGNLTNLTNMQLYENELSGLIPEGIGNLTDLTSLNLKDNKLTGVPSSISNLQNLNQFFLQGNQITSLPASIADMTTNIQIQNNLIEELPDLTNLEPYAVFVTNNYLDFEDFLQNPDRLVSLEPQKIRKEDVYISYAAGDTIDLDAFMAGTGNKYQWQENHFLTNFQDLPGDTNFTFYKDSADPDVHWLRIRCEITNPAFNNVELYSQVFNISFCGGTTLASDSLALLHLYDSTEGPNWIRRTGWDQVGNKPVRQWEGVVMKYDSVAQIDRVDRIDLSENNLEGKVPPQLDDLSELKYLNLNNNNLDEYSHFSSTDGLLIELAGNAFTFSDIVPIVPNGGGAYLITEYANQDSIYAEEMVVIETGAAYSIEAEIICDGSPDCAEAFNLYTWYKVSNSECGGGDSVVFQGVGAAGATFTITDANPLVHAGTYYCEIINAFATELTIVRRPVLVDVVTDNEGEWAVQVGEAKLLVYPNPFNGEVTIDTQSLFDQTNPQPMQVAVYNSLGGVVHQSSLSSTTGVLGLESLERGVYFLEVTAPSSGKRFVERLVRR